MQTRVPCGAPIKVLRIGTPRRDGAGDEQARRQHTTDESPRREDGGGAHPVCLFSLRDERFDSPPVDPMPDWAWPLASVAMKRALGKAGG
ncbi:MAG: hypothetical protein U5K56_12265 [Halioglobus sp.]|nr:hypothetical protein [Halioglobus sp.]